MVCGVDMGVSPIYGGHGRGGVQEDGAIVRHMIALLLSVLYNLHVCVCSWSATVASGLRAWSCYS